ncbi:PLP-dependent aminotransferase family protein [Sphingobacterium spiritivorum]|uniref:MocR-like pyridoxine biosynthesis transcription factor PdxR n=1 Tax=Sphingobacterium spiritivorum TaxID=258 RepID=UPI003DA49DA7
MIRPWNLEMQLDFQAEKSVYLQIADAIIEAIRSGRLKKGEALPGTRSLSEHIGVNRNTVVEAVNVLQNEGWIITKERAGTFVAEEPPVRQHNTPDLAVPVKTDAAPDPIYTICFDDGYPDSRVAPVKELARAYRQIFNQKARWQMMGYTNALGDEAFRAAIARMLNHNRGMKIDIPHICITRGSQMALYLAAQSLIQKGDYVLVEDPGYHPAWEAFEHAGARLLPVRVDEDGLIISDIIRHLQSGISIKAIYTTPHHQYPTTVTLSLSRRVELIRLSNQYGFTIIEDDYDNEFHFGRRPILPLSSYNEIQNYIYIGTMSKVVAPALRIGYLVSEASYIQKIGALRKIIDVQGDNIMEQAVLQLIEDGTIKKHLKKMTLYYRNKRDTCIRLLDQYMKDKADYHLPDGGLACWVVPRQQQLVRHLEEKLKEKGIRISGPEKYNLGQDRQGLRLSYGALSEIQLEEGIRMIADFL